MVRKHCTVWHSTLLEKGRREAQTYSLLCISALASDKSHSSFQPGANSFLGPQPDSDDEKKNAGRGHANFTLL